MLTKSWNGEKAPAAMMMAFNRSGSVQIYTFSGERLQEVLDLASRATFLN